MGNRERILNLVKNNIVNKLKGRGSSLEDKKSLLERELSRNSSLFINKTKKEFINEERVFLLSLIKDLGWSEKIIEERLNTLDQEQIDLYETVKGEEKAERELETLMYEEKEQREEKKTLREAEFLAKEKNNNLYLFPHQPKFEDEDEIESTFGGLDNLKLLNKLEEKLIENEIKKTDELKKAPRVSRVSKAIKAPKSPKKRKKKYVISAEKMKNFSQQYEKNEDALRDEIQEIKSQDTENKSYSILYDRLNEIESAKGAKWGKEEIDFVVEKRNMGYSFKAIATVLKRPERVVNMKYHENK